MRQKAQPMESVSKKLPLGRLGAMVHIRVPTYLVTCSTVKWLRKENGEVKFNQILYANTGIC